MKVANGWRWGLVTFCGCMTCGVIGAQTGWNPGFGAAVIVSFIVAAFGGLAIAENGA